MGMSSGAYELNRDLQMFYFSFYIRRMCFEVSQHNNISMQYWTTYILSD